MNPDTYIYLVVGGVFAYFWWKKKNDTNPAHGEPGHDHRALEDLESKLAEWEFASQIIKVIQAARVGNIAAAIVEAEALLREFANESDALNKQKSNFDYQLFKRLKTEEIEAIKIEVDKAYKAQLDAAETTIKKSNL